MKLRFFILLIIFSLSSRASTYDSLLFSSDGKFVLFKSHDASGLLNGCPVDWYELYGAGNYKRLEIIAIYSDSAYTLTYSDTLNIRPTFRTKDCLTDAQITNRYSINQFISNYKLTLKAYQSEESLALKIDTIKVYNKKEYNEDQTYFDLSIKLLMSSQVIQTDTVSTNLPDDIHFKQSAYKLYFSENNKFFFLYGGYSVGSYGGVGTYISESRMSRLLNKNYR
jgi:hypothetical protein